MEPRKIALLTPSVRLLGARRSLLALAKALDTSRFVPIVVCPRRGDLEEELRKAGIATHIQALPPWRKAKSWLMIPFHVRRLRQWARDLDIRLTHAGEPHSLPYGLRVGRKLRIPTLSHVRLSVTERMIRNYDLAKADGIVAVSHAIAEPFRALLDDFEKRVRVIYNGLDVDEWRRAAGDAQTARREIRRQLGLAPDAFLVGHLGLISRRKQQHLLVEAAKCIAARREDCHFLIVGDPSPAEIEYGNAVAVAIERGGLTERITIWPFRRDIEPVCAALDVNLLISSDEGFGRVAIEAGAVGVPTIGTRIGGIPEVIVEGETGLLVGVSDAEGLAAAIERLAADAVLRRRLGEAARQRVEREFTIEVHTRRIMDLYEEVLEAPI